MIISSPKRINPEDFAEDDKAIAKQIGFVMNSFMEEIVNTLSKRISINDNLNQSVKSIPKVNVDVNGNLNTPKSFKSGISGKTQGLQVIRSFGGSYVTGEPFIDFRDNNGIIKINNIKGLTADIDYTLYVLVIGD